MGFYCHGCENLYHANEQLLSLVSELLIVRHNKQPCFRTEKDVPMGMGRTKERRIRKALKTLADSGYMLFLEEGRKKTLQKFT